MTVEGYKWNKTFPFFLFQEVKNKLTRNYIVTFSGKFISTENKKRKKIGEFINQIKLDVNETLF